VGWGGEVRGCSIERAGAGTPIEKQAACWHGEAAGWAAGVQLRTCMVARRMPTQLMKSATIMPPVDLQPSMAGGQGEG